MQVAFVIPSQIWTKFIVDTTQCTKLLNRGWLHSVVCQLTLWSLRQSTLTSSLCASSFRLVKSKVPQVRRSSTTGTVLMLCSSILGSHLFCPHLLSPYSITRKIRLEKNHHDLTWWEIACFGNSLWSENSYLRFQIIHQMYIFPVTLSGDVAEVKKNNNNNYPFWVHPQHDNKRHPSITDRTFFNTTDLSVDLNYWLHCWKFKWKDTSITVVSYILDQRVTFSIQALLI